MNAEEEIVISELHEVAHDGSVKEASTDVQVSRLGGLEADRLAHSRWLEAVIVCTVRDRVRTETRLVTHGCRCWDWSWPFNQPKRHDGSVCDC